MNRNKPYEPKYYVDVARKKRNNNKYYVLVFKYYIHGVALLP